MFEALLAALAIALLSLTGVFFFGRSGHLVGSHRYMVPFAIGIFLGVVFFDLIPETLEAAGEAGSIAIAGGFLAFYLLSHLLKTYHHHHHHNHHEADGCENKAGANMLLIGDGVHNIADGVVIASAFLINPGVGVATAIGIALHEIPQEIAEYGVLLKAGYTKSKALLLNFLSASSIFFGVLLTIFFSTILEGSLWILTGIAAGNLLYIAASDLIPELNSQQHHGHFLPTFISTLLGLILIVFILGISHEYFAENHAYESTTTPQRGGMTSSLEGFYV